MAIIWDDGLRRRLSESQNFAELTIAADRIAALHPQVVLELGSFRGGSLAVWAQCATPDATLIAVDTEPQRVEPFALEGQESHIVQGRTDAPSVRAAVESILGGRLVDFLFIDANHARVAADYEAWRDLVRPGGIIGFHDVAHDDQDAFQTHAFWKQFKDLPTAETIWEAGVMGIGLLRV